MKFEIKHTTSHYLRLRFVKRTISDNEAYNLNRLLLEQTQFNITDITIHKNPAGLIIHHDGDNNQIVEFLKGLDLDSESLKVVPETLPDTITSKEEFYKKMTPALKREFKKEIIFEAAIDTILPAPLGLVYHFYQLANLEAKA